MHPKMMLRMFKKLAIISEYGLLKYKFKYINSNTYCTLVERRKLYKIVQSKNLIKNVNAMCSNGSYQNWILKNYFCIQAKLSFDNDELHKYLNELILENNNALETYHSENISSEEKLKLGKKLEYFQPVVKIAKVIQARTDELLELKKIIADEKVDKDLLILAKKDVIECEKALLHSETEIFQILLPDSSVDNSNIVLEVKAGVGGQEAMLFAKEIFEMYINFANWKRWEVQLIHVDKSDLGGLRHGSVLVFGKKAFKYFKYEGGVHRVQRIPATEKSGRVHTSTASVAILPQPDNIDINLNPKDLKIETTRSTGKGGQHVNTTDTCVRVVHLPTGISAECQQERSQIRNKEVALKNLYARLYQKQFEEQMENVNKSRKLQVGTSGRSEKIRTYNYNQDRITDHRIGQSTFNIHDFLNGTEELNNMIELLLQEEKKEHLLEVIQRWKNTAFIS